MADLAVSEGVAGVWHYHLSQRGQTSRALCGAKTMMTGIPVTAWGKPFGEHFPKQPTWCKACEAAKTAKEQQE